MFIRVHRAKDVAIQSDTIPHLDGDVLLPDKVNRNWSSAGLLLPSLSQDFLFVAEWHPHVLHCTAGIDKFYLNIPVISCHFRPRADGGCSQSTSISSQKNKVKQGDVVAFGGMSYCSVCGFYPGYVCHALRSSLGPVRPLTELPDHGGRDRQFHFRL